MNHGLMEGMLWAGALLVVIPLLIGAAVALVIVRRNREAGDREDEGSGARA